MVSFSELFKLLVTFVFVNRKGVSREEGGGLIKGYLKRDRRPIRNYTSGVAKDKRVPACGKVK